MRKIQVGTSDFKEIIENNYLFIDKTLFIRDIVEDGSKVILIPRPRRFGKTLNMSMVKYFFNNEGNQGHLFKGLKIENHKSIMEMQGMYPVIFISFKEVKSINLHGFYYKMKETISREYMKHDYLLRSGALNEYEKSLYKDIIELKAENIVYENSLSNLILYLKRYYEEKVILLIDEYDVPIQEAYLNNYYEEAISFMRNLLGAALKDNNNLYKGILTGILKVTKESIFSGLNNITVYNLLEKRYGDDFGFTEEELDELLNIYNLNKDKNEVKSWYNGYKFGDETIYNPWSVLNFINNKEDGLRPYWANTSGNEIIKELLLEGGANLKGELELLLDGKEITKAINENIVMNEIKDTTENIWSFLLFSGYLKVVERKLENGVSICKVKIPNKEVEFIYREIILKTFKESLKDDEFVYMLQALVTGDVETFEMIFADIVEKSLSYFDVKEDGENFYHAFVLGILVALNKTHKVKSNRESGYGRYDVMVIPKDISKIGIIIEFKKVNKRRKETLEEAVHSGLKQIEDKNYRVEMEELGIKNIVEMAIGFQGKEILIKEGENVNGKKI
ncbi:MAG: AAA family ATPase [Clostridium sp.]